MNDFSVMKFALETAAKGNVEYESMVQTAVANTKIAETEDALKAIAYARAQRAEKIKHFNNLRHFLCTTIVDGYPLAVDLIHAKTEEEANQIAKGILDVYDWQSMHDVESHNVNRFILRELVFESDHTHICVNH